MNSLVSGKGLEVTDLKSALGLTPKILLCGYGLSEEVQIPQFDAIQSGVWSGHPQNLNPFSNEEARKTILCWFGWRMHLISRKNYRVHFACAESLVNSLKIGTVATQAVDGQLGISNAIELYGNIFRGRCILCHAQYPNLHATDFDPENKPPSCEFCSGAVVPDVAMFGWNQQEEANRLFASTYESAKLIITIGINDELRPAIGLQTQRDSARRIIGISSNRITLFDGMYTRQASIEDIAKMANASLGTQLLTTGGPGYRISANFLAHFANAVL